MHALPLEDDFRAFARTPLNAVEGGLLVARVLDPATDAAWVHEELARHAAQLAGVADGAGVVGYLHEAGFNGAEAYYVPENSSLAHVLRTRRGIPITLALVVLGVAEQLGLDAVGINFPRHFLARVEGVLIDPFTMRVVEMREIEASLAGTELDATRALQPATPVDIVLRMLNNLRLIARHRDAHAQALDLTGYQLLLSPDPLPLHIERVDLWLAVGAPDMARHELDRALMLAPNEALRQRLAARRLEIADTPPRLH